MTFSHLHLDSAIIALAVLVVTIVVARLSGRAFERMCERGGHRIFSFSLYSSLIQLFILIIGVLTVLDSLGIAITPILTTLGLGGLAVALALNDTLSNLFAGIQIITARQLRIGDYVKFDFAEGEVTDIQWHNTIVRDPQNNAVVIPNIKVNTSVFTNFSRAAHTGIVPVTATLAWKGSAQDLRAIAERAANGAPVGISAINEASVQVTAQIPVESVRERKEKTAEFLDRLYDAAYAAKMGG